MHKTGNFYSKVQGQEYSMSENSKQHYLHNPNFFPRVWALIVQVPSRPHLLYQEEWQNRNFPQWNSPLLGSLCDRYPLGDTRGFASGYKGAGRARWEISPNATFQQPSDLCARNIDPSWLHPSAFNGYEWSQRSLMRLKPDPRNPQAPGSWVGLENFHPRFGSQPKCLWRAGS